MIITVRSRSGQVCRELRDLLSSVDGIDPSITCKGSTPPLSKWILEEETEIFLPILGSDSFGVESEQTAQSLSNLLERMGPYNSLERQATLECSLFLRGPENYLSTVRIRCEGVIAPAMKGSDHFGFDSIFIKYGYDKTFAELSEPVRNRVSHRRKAFDKLRNTFERLELVHAKKT